MHACVGVKHKRHADFNPIPHTHTHTHTHTQSRVSPWKQSRYSSFCGALVTWMMEMGKLWEEAENTAEASDTSFLSRNSVEEHTGPGGKTMSPELELW